MYSRRSIPLVLVWILLHVDPASSQELAPSVLQQVKSATVFVEAFIEERGIIQQGSGFFIGKDLIATNASVVLCPGYLWNQRQSKIVVFINSGSRSERRLSCELAAINYSDDIAFLRVDSKGLHPDPLSFLTSDQVEETMKVFISGYPLGEALSGPNSHPTVTVSSGSVSSLKVDSEESVGLLQIDGSIVAGVGGGPIVNEKGLLVGMSLGKLSGTQIAFAVPSDALLANFEGSIDQIKVEFGAKGNHRYELILELLICDPKSKIKSGAIYCWTCPAGTARSIDPDHLEKAYGQKNDSPKTTIKLGASRPGMGWGHRKDDFHVPPGHELWIQPAIAIGRTIKYGKPMNMTEDLEKFLTESEARAKQFASGPDEVLNREAELAMSGFSASNVPKDIDEQRTPHRVPIAPKPQANRRNRDASKEADMSKESRPLSESTLTAAEIREISLGGKQPTQVAATADGKHVLCLYGDESIVRVFTLPDFGDPHEIKFPETPSSIFCDEKHVVVSCTQSKVALMLDAEEMKIRHVFRLKDMPRFGPHRICRRTPDDGILTIWRDLSGSESDRLIRLYDDGRMELAGIVIGEWANYAFDNRYVIQSNSGHGSDWSSPMEFHPKSMELVEFFERQSLLNTSQQTPFFLPAFSSIFHDALIVPTFRRPTGLELTQPPLFESYLFESSFTARPTIIPGCVIAEAWNEEDKQSLFVSWQASRFRHDPSSGSTQFDYDFLFCRRSDGQILRKVHFATDALHWDPITWTKFNFEHVVYFPTRRALLLQRSYSANGKFYWVELDSENVLSGYSK